MYFVWFTALLSAAGSSSRAESEYVALVRWIHEGLDAYKVCLLT